MINLSEVGASAGAPTAAGVDVTFGVYLPGITDVDGFRVYALVLHSDNRFDPAVQPMPFPLDYTGGPNGLWTKKVTITPRAGTSFGLPGRYLYRYQLQRQMADGTSHVVTLWFTDPFARNTDDVGQLAACDTVDGGPAFVWHDDDWKVPELADLVVYELQVEEFNFTFDGVRARLPYLQSLGVNCLELMPVTSLKLDFDWGYGPLHYFAPNERWGGAAGFKALVDACHQAGVAVIIDVVYQHVDDTFPYYRVYADTAIPSPMIDGNGAFGWIVDYTHQFARDFVQTANRYWLQEYHVDGFRYDEVTDLYTEPTGDPYAAIAYDVYNESLTLARFTPSGGTAGGEYSRVIQCPEALNRPQEVLRQTYSSTTWQDGLLDDAEGAAQANCRVSDDFVKQVGLIYQDYPTAKTVRDITGNPVDMPVLPFQYLNSHDHSHLIAFLPENLPSPAPGGGPAPYTEPLADRRRWYKLQPFAIALYTCVGIPMLWQGEEFCDNWILAPSNSQYGDLRTHTSRDVHWEDFYDASGHTLVWLYRTLGTLRRTYPALRSRDVYYYNMESRIADGIVAYRRSTPNQVALVFLNVSDAWQTITLPAPVAGTFRELVDTHFRPATTPLELKPAAPGDPMTVTVPPNYGYVFVDGF